MTTAIVWLRQGSALPVLQALIAATGATHVYWNRVYDPESLARDQQVKATLRQVCSVHSFNASLLKEPWEVLKADGTPYKVFTPFWKAMLQYGIQHLPLPCKSCTLSCQPVAQTIRTPAISPRNPAPHNSQRTCTLGKSARARRFTIPKAIWQGILGLTAACAISSGKSAGGSLPITCSTTFRAIHLRRDNL
jgi:deoxyribodipyrimidine photolyase